MENIKNKSRKIHTNRRKWMKIMESSWTCLENLKEELKNKKASNS